MKSFLLTLLASTLAASLANARGGTHCRMGSFENDITVDVSNELKSFVVKHHSYFIEDGYYVLGFGISRLIIETEDIKIFDLYTIKENDPPKLNGVLIASKAPSKKSKLVLGERHIELMGCWEH